jgi:hypothetical protein
MDVVQEMIDRDDWQQHTHDLTICIQIWAWVMEDLMALVGEKCQPRGQETPLSIRGGIKNIPNGGGRAA